MKRQTSTTTEDLLRVEGVGAKGFGIVPRYAMCDPDLSWAGKVLYAYLCALAGSGNQTWPKRETILRHLGINKGTYYEAQKELVQQGYVEIRQTRNRNRQGTNIYSLVSCPSKIKDHSPSDSKSMINRVISRGLKAGGYGMLPRLVMQEQAFCAKTKLVYAYLASYAGAGSSAFPSTQAAISHLRLNQRMWQRAIRELSSSGYLEVQQRRVKGRFNVYDYYLLDVKKKVPEVKKQDTESKAPEVRKQDTEPKAPEVRKQDTEPKAPEVRKQDTEPKAPEVRKQDTEPKAPEVKKQDTEPETPEVKKQDTETAPEVTLRDTQKQDTESTDTYFNNLSTVLSSNNNLSIYQQQEIESVQANETEDRLIDYDSVKMRLKTQLKLNQPHEAEAVYGNDYKAALELLNLLSDTLAGADKSFQIGKQEKPKAPLWELRPEHLLYVIESVRTQRSQQRIYNMRAYLLTALYHAPETLTAYQEGYAADCDRVEMQRNAIQENQREMAALLVRLREE